MNFRTFVKIALVIGAFNLQLLLQAAKRKKEVRGIVKVKSFECNTSDEGRGRFFNNMTCYLKVWNRRTPTMNVYIDFKVPVTRIYVGLNFFC
jgi:hypothetical protein